MSIDIRLPNITGKTDAEQLSQIRSYLYQFAAQLRWALSQTESGSVPAVTSASGAAGSGGDAASNFSELKSLIIKSADIVESYTQQISKRLSGSFVSQSEFGTYQQSTDQTLQADSERITLLYENLQELSGTVGDLYDATIATSAYLKSGLLTYGEDGSPVYGLEIGQTNTVNGEQTFNKFARFSSSRLSFFDRNDTEVAYISDYKLCIANAHIAGTLQLGSFMLDPLAGLAVKWTGGV